MRIPIAGNRSGALLVFYGPGKAAQCYLAGSGAASRLRFLRLRLRAKAAFTRFFSPGFR